MEPHETQSPTNKTKFTVIGLIAGTLLGYPLSYFFQPGWLRAKISLGKYIQHASEIILDEDGLGLQSGVFLGFIVAIGVCMAAGFLIGQALDQKK